MKIVFMGTPDFARSALEKIIEAGHEVVLVVTQPDKPKGRSGQLQISDVKACALEHNIEVFQPVRIKEADNVAFLKGIDADIYVVAAFGQMLSQEILDIPRFGCVNIHASILPEYRGAAPIQQAIIDGKKTTGVTIMQMAAGMDTGDILLCRKMPISEDDTGGSLFDKLSVLGGELIVEALPLIENGSLKPVPQDEEKATKCGKLTKELGEIDFTKDAGVIRNLIRGLNPWPSAYTTFDNKMLKIWNAQKASEEEEKDIFSNAAIDDAMCGEIVAVTKDAFFVKTKEGYLKVLEVQLEGKKRMNVRSFLMGNRIEVGKILGKRN